MTTQPIYKELIYQKQHNTLRPKSLNDFAGQTKIKENLQVYLEAAQIRNIAIDHILFSGPPGLGKTTLAQILAESLDSNFYQITAPHLNRPGDLVKILTSIEEKDILFIDEIHRLQISIEETLYSVMEDFRLDIAITQMTGGTPITLDLPHFTLIGATTKPGTISAPLRDRFGIHEHMSFYSHKELKEILKRNAVNWNLDITESVLELIVNRSRKTPRVAIKLLKRISDFALVEQHQNKQDNIEVYKINITSNTVKEVFQKLDIDAEGLTALDRSFLHVLAKDFNGGPVGIKPITSILAEDHYTIENFVEPFLIQEKFIYRSPQGRKLSSKGYTHLDKHYR